MERKIQKRQKGRESVIKDPYVTARDRIYLLPSDCVLLGHSIHETVHETVHEIVHENVHRLQNRSRIKGYRHVLLHY